MIALAGCGKMGAAMLSAWLSSDVTRHVHVLEPNEIPKKFQDNPKITHHKNGADFSGALNDSDILVLAIKPQTMDEFFDAVKMPQNLSILSIMAGKTIAAIAAKSGANAIIRAMPNLPAAIGKGITVATSSSNVSGAAKTLAAALLSPLGQFEWTEDEKIMDAVTAVSGSGPAYVFYLIECMAAAGEKAGLPPDLAMKLARQTVIGAAALAESEPQISAAMLRENVTSPNGTTAAALSVLMDGRFQTLMNESINLAIAKSKLLSKK